MGAASELFSLASGKPAQAQGGGFGAISGGSATVSNAGRFRAKLPIFPPQRSTPQGFVIITGTFGRHSRESGQFTTRFSKLSGCNGTSPYATVAK